MTVRVSYVEPVGKGVHRWTTNVKVRDADPIAHVVEGLEAMATSRGRAVTQILIKPVA